MFWLFELWILSYFNTGQLSGPGEACDKRVTWLYQLWNLQAEVTALKTPKQGNAAILHRNVGFAVCPGFFESPAQPFRACSSHLNYQLDSLESPEKGISIEGLPWSDWPAGVWEIVLPVNFSRNAQPTVDCRLLWAGVPGHSKEQAGCEPEQAKKYHISLWLLLQVPNRTMSSNVRQIMPS